MRRAAAGLLALFAFAPAAHAANVPVLGAEVPAGKGARVPLKPAQAPARTVDGQIGDWTGVLPGFGGALIHSRGTLVYQDHLFDAWGPDNGQDQQRMAIEEPLQAAVPETYRVDPALEYAPDEFGIPLGPFTFATHYGDLDHQDQADLSEVRLGTDDAGDLWLLARTTTMNDANPGTALLVLLDTKAGETPRTIGFDSGLQSTAADTALLLTGDRGFAQDLASGAVTPLAPGSVATNAAGYDNAIEARIPASLLGGASAPRIAVAAGKPNAAGAGLENVANVAFRTAEPARDFWDKRQALALEQATVDPFFTRVDLAALRAGANERYRPLSGYHDRIFQSSPTISRESGRDGVLQHYGLYLPTSYSPDRRHPVQWWFHFRGGRAHIAAAVVPGVIEQMGEQADSVVVTPNGRGSSTWYVGKGQVDYQEVWADVHELVRLDRNREYIAGHSMGGWASWLLPILQPDRWAAAFPASGPPTQGLWAGCEDDPCFQSANDGRPRDEWTTPLLENLTHVPYVNYHGAADELVPVSGVTAQMLRMRELGLRYRYYLFPHEEHYGPPIVDEWADGVEYEHRFARNRNPGSFTFIRSMPMETAVEQVNSGGVPLSFDFDRAYWMSGLEPVNPARGVARIEARSLAIPEPAHDVLPDVVPPLSAKQLNPAITEGQQWVERPGSAPEAKNAFALELTGAKAVRLSTKRMRLKPRRAIAGEVTTEHPLRLELVGNWADDLAVTIDGVTAAVARDGRVLAIEIPAGTHKLAID